jgi:hypothetical protein
MCHLRIARMTVARLYERGQQVHGNNEQDYGPE